VLKQKLEKLEQRLGGQEPVVVWFIDVPGPELTPELEAELVAEARRMNPHSPVLFIEWPCGPELGTKGKKRVRKKRGS